eukprot:707959-Hanusia_phi.AAC.2
MIRHRGTVSLVLYILPVSRMAVPRAQTVTVGCRPRLRPCQTETRAGSGASARSHCGESSQRRYGPRSQTVRRSRTVAGPGTPAARGGAAAGDPVRIPESRQRGRPRPRRPGG